MQAGKELQRGLRRPVLFTRGHLAGLDKHMSLADLRRPQWLPSVLDCMHVAPNSICGANNATCIFCLRQILCLTSEVIYAQTHKTVLTCVDIRHMYIAQQSERRAIL